MNRTVIMIGFAFVGLLVLLCLVAAFFVLLGAPSGPAVTSAPAASALQSTSTPATSIGKRTKTSGCVVNGKLSDPACTPGAILPQATKEEICVPGYSKNVRNVSTSEKDQVFAEYGVTERSLGEYEVDHLISLELGGSNEIANLWPEAAEPKPGFHEKDKVENYMHDQVCSGAISLQQAQIEIATNWLQIYDKMPGK
jgi:hypothetical protein